MPAHIRPEVVEDESLTTVAILANRRAVPRNRRRSTPFATADQLIDDAVRRWRFGLSRRVESNSRFPRSGHR